MDRLDPPNVIGMTSPRRRLVAWLGMLVVAFNLAGTGLLPIAPAPGGTGDHLVVCTALGLVEINPDGTPVDGSKHDPAAGLCAFCLPLTHGAAQAPGLVAVPRPQPSPMLVAAVAAPVSAPRIRVYAPASPRAPPRFV